MLVKELKKTDYVENDSRTKTLEKPMTVEELNKKIGRTIRFKDRMVAVNEALKAGKSEQELELSSFEIDLRAREGNHQFVKLENGKFVKLFSWELIKRSVEKIKRLCEEKKDLI
jgi:hypothetical protein